MWSRKNQRRSVPRVPGISRTPQSRRLPSPNRPASVVERRPRERALTLQAERQVLTLALGGGAFGMLLVLGALWMFRAGSTATSRPKRTGIRRLRRPRTLRR